MTRYNGLLILILVILAIIALLIWIIPHISVH